MGNTFLMEKNNLKGGTSSFRKRANRSVCVESIALVDIKEPKEVRVKGSVPQSP